MQIDSPRWTLASHGEVNAAKPSFLIQTVPRIHPTQQWFMLSGRR